MAVCTKLSAYVYVYIFDTVLHHMEKSEVFPFRHISFCCNSLLVDDDGESYKLHLLMSYDFFLSTHNERAG